MGKMKNSLTCPKCGSTHWDYANVGLPDALQCTDCGCIYPEVLSLFPKLIKNDMGTMRRSSSPANAWPFPTSLRPNDRGLPKYNPNNEEDAPI